MPEPALYSEQLTFSYSSDQSFQFPEIEVQQGQPLLILGASGKGKTTLLHLLAGILVPTQGNVYIHSQAINQLSVSQRDAFRGRHIGLIFQRSHFVASLTVRENLRLAQSLAGVPVNDNKIAELLGALNIGHKLKQKPQFLSVGEQQRVAIARAFLHQPKVVLADEPTSALDDENTQQVLDLLAEQATAAGTTLIIVTHDSRLKNRFPHQVTL